MAYINGTTLTLKFDAVGGTPVALTLETESSITIEQEELDVTGKGSGGFTTLVAGKKSGSISFTAFIDNTAANNVTELSAFFNAGSVAGQGTNLGFDWGSSAFSVAGDGLLTSLDVSAGTEEIATISGSISLSGAYVVTAA